MSSIEASQKIEPPSYAEVMSGGYSGPSDYQTQYSAPNEPSAPPLYSMHDGHNGKDAALPPPPSYTAPNEAQYRNTIPGDQPYRNTVPGSQQYRNTIPGGQVSDGVFPPESTQATCLNCQQTVTTNVEKGCGNLSRCLCCVLSIWGLCWIVICCDAYKDTVHYCPTCKTELGRCKAVEFNQVHSAPGTTVIHRQ